MDCSWITSALYYIIPLIYTVSALMGKSTGHDISLQLLSEIVCSHTTWIYIFHRRENKVLNLFDLRFFFPNFCLKVQRLSSSDLEFDVQFELLLLKERKFEYRWYEALV